MSHPSSESLHKSGKAIHRATSDHPSAASLGGPNCFENVHFALAPIHKRASRISGCRLWCIRGQNRVEALRNLHRSSRN